jgi:hypothetical protein
MNDFARAAAGALECDGLTPLFLTIANATAGRHQNNRDVWYRPHVKSMPSAGTAENCANSKASPYSSTAAVTFAIKKKHTVQSG